MHVAHVAHAALQDPAQQRLASYLSWQIRNDTSPVYGDGFREAYEAFQVRSARALPRRAGARAPCGTQHDHASCVRAHTRLRMHEHRNT